MCCRLKSSSGPRFSLGNLSASQPLNGNPTAGIPGDKKEMVEFASDVIVHF
jgi:hypothetical protein